MMDSSASVKYLFSNRAFVLFLISRFCNVIGVQILTVAVGWHVYQLTHDPLDLGYIGLAQFAPSFLLFIVAGYISDRYDRRATLVVSNLVHVGVAVALMGVLGHHWGGVNIVLILLVFHGSARTFYHTASQAILPNIVDARLFPMAVAYASSVNKAAQLIGPAFGGALIAWAGDWTYHAMIFVFVVAAISSGFIWIRAVGQSPGKFTLVELLGGFSYVWANKVVLGAISIDLAAVLLGGVMGLLPIYASDILKVGPEGLGLMRAMPGIGALLTGLGLAQIARPRYVGFAMFAALGTFGVSVIVFSLSEIFWLSLLALAVYGASDMISVYIRLTLVQIATPDSMRGRVSAINSISINASNELGDFRAGLMASGLGVAAAVLFGGVATLAIAVSWVKIFPALLKIDFFEEVAPKGNLQSEDH
mgnify:CR=1 FL=1|tara:strand:+ start:1450 stop:2709 length:1260 start_codon:yes stop_codon:yes gene_type:complete